MKQKAIAVGSNPRVTLKPFLLEATGEGNTRPIVIVCPGGGFLGHSPVEGAPVARMLNRAGYHSAVLAYSTKATAPGVDAYPQVLFDLADAICMVRNRAEEWGVDSSRVVILGFSAGGWLCAMYENLWASELFLGHGSLEQRRPDATVLCYPLVDYRNCGMIANEEIDLSAVLGLDDVRADGFQAAMKRALVGDRLLTDELVSEVSPINHIGRATPPTFVWTSFGDGLLEPAQSLAYAQRLHEMGVPCELHVFNEGFHGISLATEATAHRPVDKNDHVAHWAELMCEWLELVFEA